MHFEQLDITKLTTTFNTIFSNDHLNKSKYISELDTLLIIMTVYFIKNILEY